MWLRYIINNETGEKTMFFQDGDFEMENPVKQYGEQIITKQMILKGVPEEELNGRKELSEKSKEIFKNAVDLWIEIKKGFQRIKVPKNLIQLLKTDGKKDQQKLLKGLVLSPEILTSFIFKAYHEFGFTLSQYTKKGHDTTKIPFAKIIDHGKNWHCFFSTFNSWSEETWLGKNKSHIHYISNAFGLSRGELVKKIKSGKYRLDDLPHITLEQYGNP